MVLVEVLGVAGAVYAALNVYMFAKQKSILYRPDTHDIAACSHFSKGKTIEMNGTRARFHLVSDKLVIFYHGRRGSICDRAFLQSFFEDLGYSSLFVSLAGFGGDKRKSSLRNVQDDVRHVIAWLRERQWSSVVVFGESLGSAVAAFHAKTAMPQKLVLVSSFTSMTAIAKRRYPYLLSDLLLTEKYDTKKWLNAFSQNLLIIHGTNDAVCPFDHAVQLRDAAASLDRKVIPVEGVGHNNVFRYKKTMDAIREFL
ncbi:hypothetical protein GF342_04985 [Candidatus Woesearchaeota archaeon]|nr:hypothetical protein [Candidatus Woesearchaeota archaeon]